MVSRRGAHAAPPALGDSGTLGSAGGTGGPGGEGGVQAKASVGIRAANALVTVLLVALFLFGAAFALYPAYNNLYNEYLNARIAAEYDEMVAAMDAETAAKALEEARAYNARHKVNVIYDPFAGIVEEHGSESEGAGDREGPSSAAQSGSSAAGDAGDSGASSDASLQSQLAYGPDAKIADLLGGPDYERLLNVRGDGVMGFVDIPVIGVRLAMYHGTSPEVLDKGIGHLPGTSLPVGGKDTHCVLSGHRGLPAAKLLTDLDQVAKGDRFYLHVLGEVCAYEVDDIRVVKPEDVSTLNIENGQDLATLVTCTPYGVNTHRMLVRGHRVPYDPPEVTQSAASWLAAFTAETLAFAAVMSLIVLVTFVVFIRRVAGKAGPGGDTDEVSGSPKE